MKNLSLPTLTDYVFKWKATIKSTNEVMKENMQ